MFSDTRDGGWNMFRDVADLSSAELWRWNDK